MASYMQPRANLGSVSRQPFRPGQWQGFKGVSNNTTYIQNNFYGSSIFDANRNYGYPTCNHNCDNDDSKTPGWMKWMMGIGVGSQILGGILGLFKKDEKGDTTTTPAEESTDTRCSASGSEPVTEQRTSEPIESSSSTPTETPTSSPTSDYSSLNSLSDMVCCDASGKTANISGSFAVKEAGADGEPPKSITITDSSSGTAHEYTYELTDTSSDGKPIYTCKSMNGNAATTDNAYTLEMNGNNGKPELVQYQEQNNYGSGLKFATKSTNNNTSGGDVTGGNTISASVTPPPVSENEEVDKP